MIEFISDSHEMTSRLGKAIGEVIPPRTVLILSGELGSGKTMFAQGLARGLDVKEQVVSPTYTIAQTYEDGRLPFAHMDAYRLAGEDIYDIGLEEYWMNDGVVAIEWGDILSPVLPAGCIFIGFFRDGSTADRDSDGSGCMVGRRKIVFDVILGKYPWLEEVLACIS